jgi:hypothetical protein
MSILKALLHYAKWTVIGLVSGLVIASCQTMVIFVVVYGYLPEWFFTYAALGVLSGLFIALMMRRGHVRDFHSNRFVPDMSADPLAEMIRRSLEKRSSSDG